MPKVRKGGRREMGGGFTNANDRGGKGGGETLFPATFNTQGRFTTQEAAVKLFREKYGGAPKEYGLSVDEAGFAHRHVSGGRSSVGISAAGKNHLVVHNHPSGGAFSKADLQLVAIDKNSSGIVATSSKAQYVLKKTAKFKAEAFHKAVNKAKWPANYDYDKGADWWLKKNAKEFGYTYKRTK